MISSVFFSDPHPLYKKLVLKSTKYHVHDPDGICSPGDKVGHQGSNLLVCNWRTFRETSFVVLLIDFLQVLFEKSRPWSKHKHWIVRVVLKRDAASEYLKAHPEIAALTEKGERKRRSNTKDEAASGRV